METPSLPLLEAMFLDKVVETAEGCWIWCGAMNGTRGARGVMRIRGVMKQASHVAWFLFRGVWPEKGVYVCHTCDNGLCVNPDHLWLGTQADNMRDCVAKGRDGRRRFNEEDVREWRRRSAAGESQYQIAAEYGCGQATVNQAVRGITWRHVPND